MKVKAFKARPKREASPTRGKGNQETGWSGHGNRKAPDTEFTGRLPNPRTSDPSTTDLATDYNTKAQTDPSLVTMGSTFSSQVTTLPSDASFVDLAGTGELNTSRWLMQAS